MKKQRNSVIRTQNPLILVIDDGLAWSLDGARAFFKSVSFFFFLVNESEEEEVEVGGDYKSLMAAEEVGFFFFFFGIGVCLSI